MNQELITELKERMKNNALTDDERMSLIRIILGIDQKLPSLEEILES
jgi:hypothetical protein